MTVQHLIEAGGLTQSGAPHDWTIVEDRLQIRVPDDFRQLVDAGGAGQWFDYIRVFAPGHELPSQDLLQSGGAFEDLLVLWEDDPETRPDDLSDDSRLIPWANTSNGETLYWRVDAQDEPSAYPIYVEDADGENWERFDLTTADFLEGIMSGDVEPEAFSERFLQVQHVYRPYPILPPPP